MVLVRTKNNRQIKTLRKAVLGIRIRGIRLFLGLLPDPDPFVRGTYPGPDPAPNPSLFS